MLKEYEQIIRTPFVFRQVKPALWKAPLRESSFYLIIKKRKFLSRFFFDHVGAKRKAHFATQSCKKKALWGEFRRLRATTRTPRPRPRRLPQKAGENFHSILTKDSGLCSAPRYLFTFGQRHGISNDPFCVLYKKSKAPCKKSVAFAGRACYNEAIIPI